MTIGYTLVGNGAEKVMVFHGWFGDYSVWEPTLFLRWIPIRLPMLFWITGDMVNQLSKQVITV